MWEPGASLMSSDGIQNTVSVGVWQGFPDTVVTLNRDEGFRSLRFTLVVLLLFRLMMAASDWIRYTWGLNIV